MLVGFCPREYSSPMRHWLYTLMLLLAACQQPLPRPDASADIQDNPPQTLSAWRLFDLDAHSLAPARDGLVYELNTPLFSDYAHKLRAIHLPKGSQMRYGPEQFEFPVGTIVTKTFYYELARPREDKDAVRKTLAQPEAVLVDLQRMRLLETRLLVKTHAGWIALPYVWNKEQTEATLELAGELIELTLVDSDAREPFVYQVPDANQCAACHALDHQQQRIEPIGIKARHLNREGRHGKNQLAQWSRAGLILGVPDESRMPRNAKWNDNAQDLASRARAYLDVNCAHCHSDTGPANTSGLLLDAGQIDPTKLGVCKVPVATGRGSANGSYDVVPGAPDQSILLLRMLSTEPDIAMPELGRALIHDEGAALIRDWIASLPGQCDAP